MAFRRSMSDICLPIPEKYPSQLWGHDHWIVFVLSSVSGVVAIPEILMSHRIHGNNTSGYVRKVTAVSASGTTKASRELTRNQRYSSNNVRRRLQQYRGMLIHLTGTVAPSKKVLRIDRFELIQKTLQAEIDLLMVRLSIQTTASFGPRFARAIRYAFGGHYTRYAGPLRAAIKDILGYNQDSKGYKRKA